jgi:hypothetical protein
MRCIEFMSRFGMTLYIYRYIMIHHYLFYIILCFTSYHYFECWNSCWIRWDSIVSILFWVVPPVTKHGNGSNPYLQWIFPLKPPFIDDFPIYSHSKRIFAGFFQPHLRPLMRLSHMTRGIQPGAFVQSRQRGLNVPKMLECSAQAETHLDLFDVAS